MLRRIGAEEGGEFKAVASGTLPSGQPVVVNADGTVSVVSETVNTETVGTAVVYEAAGVTDQGVAYDANAQKIVISYKDQGNSNVGTAIVGTVSGNSISFGTPVVFDSSIVRGLEYYTGVIFEANLVSKDNDKNLPVIGSVGGGGRYDKLISRFRKDQVGASGFSIGVSRLCTVMQMMDLEILEENIGPILILNMDKDYEYSYYQMAQELRAYGIKAEVYLGTAGMKAQMKYADKKGSPLVIIEGTVEREKGIVTIKNLAKGKEVSATIGSRDNWIKNDEIQFEVIRGEAVKEISQLLKKYKT